MDERCDRERAQAALRRPRGEASHRLSADSRRCDRLSRLTGSLREPRAARSRHGARTASGGSGGGGLSDCPRPRRERARPDVVARRHAGAHRRVCGCDGRSAVDPRRSRAGSRRTLRDDDRARLPDALVVRPDALRGAASGWRVRGELRDEPGSLPGARSVRERGSAAASASSRPRTRRAASAR